MAQEELQEETKDIKPTLQTAAAMVSRIKDEVYLHGESFRQEHPELVDKLAALLAGVHRGTEIYVENKRREFNVDDVTACLDGLGYEVKPAHPMVTNAYGPFRITWWPDGKANPFLG